MLLALDSVLTATPRVEIANPDPFVEAVRAGGLSALRAQLEAGDTDDKTPGEILHALRALHATISDYAKSTSSSASEIANLWLGQKMTRLEDRTSIPALPGVVSIHIGNASLVAGSEFSGIHAIVIASAVADGSDDATMAMVERFGPNHSAFRTRIYDYVRNVMMRDAKISPQASRDVTGAGSNGVATILLSWAKTVIAQPPHPLIVPLFDIALAMDVYGRLDNPLSRSRCASGVDIAAIAVLRREIDDYAKSISINSTTLAKF
jgi:hypothetical protein